MKATLIFIFRTAIAIILIQTLYFKFTAHPESVYIFTQLGIEPKGRIGIGVLELIAGILLLINRTASVGALLSAGLMAGAILSHLTQLGIEINGDPTLFYLAVATFFLSLIVLFFHRKELPFIGSSL